MKRHREFELLPCPTCPWRMEQRASSIPNYQHAAACNLAATTIGRADGFRQIMACHYSSATSPFPCRGYLARQGDLNLNVRILAAMERIPWPSRVDEACRSAGVQLHRSYRAVLSKLSRTRGVK